MKEMEAKVTHGKTTVKFHNMSMESKSKDAPNLRIIRIGNPSSHTNLPCPHKRSLTEYTSQSTIGTTQDSEATATHVPQSAENCLLDKIDLLNGRI